MLHILWVIIKWILILLGVLLGLLLLVLLLVLFCPVRYQAEAEKAEDDSWKDAGATAWVTWLMRAVGLRAMRKDGEFALSFYIFGIPLERFRRKKKGSSEDKKKKKSSGRRKKKMQQEDLSESSAAERVSEAPPVVDSENKADNSSVSQPGGENEAILGESENEKTEESLDVVSEKIITDNLEGISDEGGDSTKSTEEKVDETPAEPEAELLTDKPQMQGAEPEKEAVSEEQGETFGQKESETHSDTESVSNEKFASHEEFVSDEKSTSKEESASHTESSAGSYDEDRTSGLSGIIQKIQDKISGIRLTVEKIRGKIGWWKDFLGHPKTQAAVRRIKKEVWMLLRHAAPRKLEGNVVFGNEDPSVTGKILAVLGMTIPLHKNRIKVQPLFDGTNTAYGRIAMEGRIYGVMLVKAAADLWFDKNIKFAFRKWKQKEG